MGEMMEHICQWDNLMLAYQRASCGKRGNGAVAAFEFYLADNLLTLQQELQTRTYQPGAYTSFTIHEPKQRLISAAPFRDRVVHHALCNVIEPLFERSFIHDSYANRLGKGNHRALDRSQHFARRYSHVLQCDVEQFFPAVDHAIMREMLARKVKDADVLWLMDCILISGERVLSDVYEMRYFAGDTLFDALRARGLPIGNLTSQFWANCFLSPFDHFVKRELRCPAYVRFVDDFLLFGDDKTTLWRWQKAIVERLGQLRLTIHPGAQPRPVCEGFPFLGFIIYPQHRRLKRRKIIAFQRRMRHLVGEWSASRTTYGQVDASLQGWINHARYGDTWGLRSSIVARLPAMHGGMPCPVIP